MKTSKLINILTLLSITAWVAYAWAYSKGYAAKKCTRKHGYEYSRVVWFNGEVK